MAPIVTQNGAEGNPAWSGASALQLRESCPHKRPPDDVSLPHHVIPRLLFIAPLRLCVPPFPAPPVLPSNVIFPKIPP